MIIDSPIISGSYLSTGSLSQTGNVSITGSLTATGGISGSFSGSGANLFDIPAAGIVGLNLSQIASGSVSASISPNQGLLINTSVSASNFTGSFTGSLTGIATSASYASFALTSSYSLGGSGFPFSGSAVITGSLIVSGSGLTITGSVSISTLTTGSGVRYVIADADGLISAQTASAVIFTTQQTIATAGQTVFPITNGYSTGYVTVFVNGSKLNEDEFTDTSGTNIVFATGSMINDVVEFQKYLPASGVSNNTLRTTNYFTTTLGQTNFTVNYTPGLLDVFYNGAKLNSTEYTAANGTSITLATGSNLNDSLEVDVYSYQVGAFSGIGGVGVAKELAFYNTTNSITGSNKVTYDGSTFSITGSFLVTGSSTFTNIGPAVFSGSVTAVGGFSGSFSGNADSASLAQNSLLLQGTGSVGFTTTASFLAVSSSQQQISASQQQLSSSFLTLTASYTALSSSYTSLSASYDTFSGSASTRITANSSSIQQVSSSQQQISASLLNVISIFATTGSNSFRETQSITGSLTVTGQIIAQSINVQQVTSSIIYSSGSNVFGCDLNSRQTFTGSFYQTGSIAVFNSCVGIGTSTPATKLHIGTTTDAENTLTIQSSATGTNKIFFSNCNSGAGLYAGFIEYQQTCNALLFGANSVERMRISSTGAACFACSVTAAAESEFKGTSVNTRILITASGVANTVIGFNNSGATTTGVINNAAYVGVLQAYPLIFTTSEVERFRIASTGAACFACELTAKTLGTNDLLLNNLNYECANYVDGTRGSWLIQEGACDLFIINQISCKKYKFNLIEIK